MAMGHNEIVQAHLHLLHLLDDARPPLVGRRGRRGLAYSLGHWGTRRRTLPRLAQALARSLRLWSRRLLSQLVRRQIDCVGRNLLGRLKPSW